MKNVRVIVYLLREQVDELKMIAAHRGDKPSALVREALRPYLAGVRENEPQLLAPLQPRRDHVKP